MDGRQSTRRGLPAIAAVLQNNPSGSRSALLRRSFAMRAAQDRNCSCNDSMDVLRGPFHQIEEGSLVAVAEAEPVVGHVNEAGNDRSVTRVARKFGILGV